MPVRHPSTKAEWTAILAEGKTVIVDFSAVWCGPCAAIGPVFDALSDDPAFSKLVFVKIDVDKNADVAGEAGVTAMPTFQVYKGGEKVDEFLGADRARLRALVEKYAAAA